MTLSVIMPALNEERNIKDSITSTLNAFKKHAIMGDIIIINDGSRDNTGKIVEKIMAKNKLIRLINHEKPKGIGYSFLDGVKNSNKDIVVMFPGDNENDPDDTLNFIDLMEKVDVLVPFIHNVEVRNRTRRTISSLYRFIINMSFGISLNYTNGTVFYRKCIFDNIELKSFGFFYQAELLIKLIRKGYLFAEVPNFLNKRSSEKSKAITLKSLFKVIKSYLHLVYEIHIRRIETKKPKWAYRKFNRHSVSYKKYLSTK